MWDQARRVPGPQRIITVLWLSFLTAGAATGVFFTLIDPQELHYCMDLPEFSRTAAYSLGFLLFWLLTATTGLLAVFFTYPSGTGERGFTQRRNPRND